MTGPGDSAPSPERLIELCEQCNEEAAQIPFDNVLDRITGSDPSVTDYMLEETREVSELPEGYFREDAY
jgi:hypothetical protein